ncbi:MAG: HAD-IA family hydrolase [Bacteroidetes bacterium]|jgi:putative hydrolase of the HAD superfamily|nr:HAD-IA family hydrolase [Bacteroidota bacterium]
MRLNQKIDSKGKIKNIIFDLGGVIMNINYHRTVDAFRDLGLPAIDEQFSQFHQLQFFSEYEIGEISSEKFRSEIRKLTDQKLSDESIDQAWNAMLLDIPPERLELLKQLKATYNTYLLSNTNDIHYNYFSNYLNKHFQIPEISGIFKQDYYSHTMGMRKPHPDIYLKVCGEQEISPDETLFIDDTLPNIEGAEKAGLKAYHLTRPETLLDLFKNGTH